jgi:hypothetical protein
MALKALKREASGTRAPQTSGYYAELSTLMENRLIPKTVSAKIHVYRVAEAVERYRNLIKDQRIVREANAFLSTAEEVLTESGGIISFRQIPLQMADARTQGRSFSDYAKFVNRAKNALLAMLMEEKNRRMQFNYSSLIDFVSRGQKDALVSNANIVWGRVNDVIRARKKQVDAGRTLDRDVAIYKTREAFEEFNRHRIRGEISLVDCFKLYKAVEAYEELALRDGVLEKEEELLLNVWGQVKMKMAFSKASEA